MYDFISQKFKVFYKLCAAFILIYSIYFIFKSYFMHKDAL